MQVDQLKVDFARAAVASGCFRHSENRLINALRECKKLHVAPLVGAFTDEDGFGTKPNRQEHRASTAPVWKAQGRPDQRQLLHMWPSHAMPHA